MDPSLCAVFVELQQLAEERNLPELASVARNCTIEERPGVILVAARDETIGAELGCQLQSVADVPARVCCASFAELSADPWRAHEAARLVLALPAGEFIDSTAHEAARRFLSPRPPDTCAVVFTGADLFASVSDLEIFERGVRSVLVSDNDETQAESPPVVAFFPRNISAGSEPSLAGRLDRDRAKLVGWLRQPFAPNVELDCLRAFALVQSLESQESAFSPPTAVASSASEPRRMRENLLRMRRRTLELVERTTASVTRELSSSLDTLQQNLRGEVQRHIKRFIEHSFLDLSEARIQHESREFLRQAFNKWACASAALIHKREAEMLQDAAAYVSDVDWRQLGAAAHSGGITESYPAALLTALQWDGQPTLRASDGNATSSGNHLVTGHTVKGAALVGTAGLATAAFFPFGTLGVLVGGILGAAGGAIVGRQMDQRQAIDFAADFTRSLAASSAQELQEAIHTLLRDICLRSRERVEEHIRKLTVAIEREANASPTPTPDASDVQPWNRLRQRIAEVAAQAAIQTTHPGQDGG